jgi:4'-phosphopantetheinyl transferase
MKVCWFEQSDQDVPFGDEWLSELERIRLAGLRIPKRHRDWRLGRWTAKCAVAAYLNLPHASGVLAGVELRPAPSGAPEVFLHGQATPLALSLSHSGGLGLCAIAPAPADVGCDLEQIEPRSPIFLVDYFSASEQELVRQTPGARRNQLVTLLWSAKESALKAMRCGLREDTRSVHATPADFLETCAGDWRRLSVTHTSGARFFGWWRESRNLIRTIVTDQENRNADQFAWI